MINYLLRYPYATRLCTLAYWGEAVLQREGERGRGKGKGRKIFGARITAPPGMKRQGLGEGEIVKAHLAKGGKRERNGARTESEGAMRVGSVRRWESWPPGWGAGRGNRLKYP